MRETLEESAWHVEVTHLVGVYLWQPPDSRKAYLRFAFAATARQHDAARRLEIQVAVLNAMEPAAELRAEVARHRSPMVMRCVDDHLAGRRLPLDWIVNLGGLSR